MVSGIFQGSRLKIERANKHIQELCSVVTAFFQTDPYRIGIENNPSRGYSLVGFRSIGPPPSEVPLIIGDTVHNLRSALDLAVCQAVHLGGGKPSRNTKFPFAKSLNELVGAQRKGKIKTHCPKLFDLIIKEIKPYRGGNDDLYALHDLDIMDKHKLIIPMVAISTLTYASGRPTVGAHGGDLSAKQGSTVYKIVKVPDLENTDYGKPTFDIFFDEGCILKNQPIIPTLHQFSKLISGIIDAFTDVYIVSDKSR
jgi:hypothetical protein